MLFLQENIKHLLSALCIQKIEFAAYFGCTAKSAQFEASCVEIEVHSIPAMIVLWQYFLTYEWEKMFISLQLQDCCSPCIHGYNRLCPVQFYCNILHSQKWPATRCDTNIFCRNRRLFSISSHLLTPPPTMLI